ncbi:MAG: hypothetical protein LRZ93_02045 [Clostridiales bacterium]|nr:hypothetical protein [Clostridiales bacterium]
MNSIKLVLQCKKLDEEQFISFLELNGVATLSHLNRAYITAVSSLTGLNPPISLPMININSLRRFKKEQSKQSEE